MIGLLCIINDFLSIRSNPWSHPVMTGISTGPEIDKRWQKINKQTLGPKYGKDTHRALAQWSDGYKMT